MTFKIHDGVEIDGKSLTNSGGNLTWGGVAVGSGGGVTINSNANNRVLTGDGSNAVGETNLTFDGTNLQIVGSSRSLITEKLRLGATDTSFIERDSTVNIGYRADGVHRFWTYNGSWLERAQITDAGLTVTGTITASGDGLFNGTNLVGDSKHIVRFSDSWLRLNPENHFTSGIYAGTGLLRTDGNFQVGSSGAKFSVNGTTGNVTVAGTVDGVDIAARNSVLTSTTTTANAALPKAGGAVTGGITSNSSISATTITGTKFALGDGNDLQWAGGYGSNKPLIAANGNVLKFYTHGASGGVEFQLTGSAVDFKNNPATNVGAITSGGNIVTTSSSAVIQTPRISMEADGTLDWGSAKNYGTLTWDTNKAIVVAQSGSSLEFKTNNSGLALTLDTSQNATFAGNIIVAGTVDGVDIAARNGTLTNTTTTANAALPKAGGTMTGGLAINTGGNAIAISSGAPQVRFNDTTSGADDFWIHVNSDRFYILADRDDSGAWEGAYPLELNAATDIGYVFNNRLFTEAYHPNADTLTTARTIAGTSFNGSAAIDISYNNLTNKPTIPTNFNSLYYTKSESDGRFTLKNDFRSLGTQAFTGTASTTGLIAEMESDGAFDSYSSVFKTSWSYAGNFNLADAGRFTETAGTSWITWTDNSDDTARGNITALAIAPTTGASAGKMFVYNDQGSSYAPGWREIWTSTSDGAGSGLDADKLDAQEGSYYLNYNNFSNTPSIPSLSGYATQSYVGTQINNLIDGAPGTLNTLNELAAAVADNSTFFSTVVPKSGGTMTGALTIDYTGNATGDAGLRVLNDNSDWGIYIDKDGSGTYGLKIAADGAYPLQITNSSGTEKFRVDSDGDIILAGTVDGRYVAEDGTKLDGIAVNANNYVLPTALTATTFATSGNVIIGGNFTNNAYASVSSTRLGFGGGNDLNNYHIGTNMENVGGNYTKFDIRWHTGIRMGAQGVYGGIRFFDSEDLGSKLMSIGEGNGVTDVKVYNNLVVNGTVDGVDIAARNSVLTSTTNTANAALPKAGGTMTGTLTTGGNIVVPSNTGVSTSGDWVKVTTNHGYIQIGPANSGHAHIYTDRSNFYFNKTLIYAAGHLMYHAGNSSQFTGTLKTKLDGIAASANNYSFPYSISAAAGVNTVALRDANGYLFGTYLNMTGTFSNAASGGTMSYFTGTNGGDNYGRSWTAAQARTLLNVENGATADQSAAEILAAIKTVDVNGASGVNAGTFDGSASSYYHNQGSTGLAGTNRISSITNFNNSVPSGFYQSSSASNMPGSSWHNMLQVRHSNTANDHGFQIAMSYYNNNLFSRSYQGGTGANNGSYQTWAKQWSAENDGAGSGLDADNLDGYTWGGVGTNIVANADIYGRSVNNAHSALYRFGGIYFTWDSDSYGTNTHHSIRSTDGDTYGDHITLNSFGNVRINFDSNGNGSNYFRIGHHTTGTSDVLLTIDEAGNATFAGNVTAYSDIRLKENIVNVDNALDKVCSMRGIYYNMIEDTTKSRRLGLVAQEVEKILPEVVIEAKPEDDKESVLSVDYGNIVALLIEGMKEQQEQINQLKKEIRGE